MSNPNCSEIPLKKTKKKKQLLVVNKKLATHCLLEAPLFPYIQGHDILNGSANILPSGGRDKTGMGTGWHLCVREC